MTDKEIIIDGVNVAKCSNFIEVVPYHWICKDQNKSNDCSQHPDCLFKQLTREKQKSEELESRCKNYYQENNDLIYKLGERVLKQNIAEEKSDKYQQALTEIREIAGQYMNASDVGHFIQDTDARHALDDSCQALADINQKAKEVLGE